MIKKGVYAATLSVFNENSNLDVEETIAHAENIIKEGLHGVFFFGSTGQSQLISMAEKKELVSKLPLSKLKNNFFLGTGLNSLNDNLEFIKYSMEYDFNTFLIMPPAYYKGNTEEGVLEFYTKIINNIPKVKIILYNFEKLSGFKFEPNFIKKLVSLYPKNITGCKDSTYNLYDKIKIKDFLMFPGDESKLLKGLEIGCSGCISAIANVTHKLAREVFDDFEKNRPQKSNEKLINVRHTFDKYNLISGLHSYMSLENSKFKNLLPPLTLLKPNDQKDLLKKLESFKFNLKKNIAA
ncbi:MAG: dihydrodipicolinate synthase family protein [Candidatus Pelagibacter sp.]|nr:dihydrodipicolinate synthase family protein [Candidatus Pelagibacter sp.]OUW68286.1 MAG: dihydrodipicolinate synthase family protein [Candidatus Pelagibacter sp. TMED202]